MKGGDKLFKYFIIAMALVLVGCTPSATEIQKDSQSWTIPQGLADCKLYALRNSSGGTLYVMRCPNSSTSTVRTGKNPSYTTVNES